MNVQTFLVFHTHVCVFADLQYFGTVGNIATLFLYEYVETQSFRSLFLLHIVHISSFYPESIASFWHHVTLPAPLCLVVGKGFRHLLVGWDQVH
jgi:hypothetical protein